MFPLLVSCLALTVIALGVGERKVRKDRRKAGWKGIGGLLVGSGECRKESAEKERERES